MASDWRCTNCGEHSPSVARLTAEVERLTRERDEARAWSARWKAVAKRIWTGVHHPLDMCESEARRREAAEAERDALAAQVAALREAGDQMAEAIDRYHKRYERGRLGQPQPMTGLRGPREAWHAALAAAGGEGQRAGDNDRG